MEVLDAHSSWCLHAAVARGPARPQGVARGRLRASAAPSSFRQPNTRRPFRQTTQAVKNPASATERPLPQAPPTTSKARQTHAVCLAHLCLTLSLSPLALCRASFLHLKSTPVRSKCKRLQIPITMLALPATMFPSAEAAKDPSPEF